MRPLFWCARQKQAAELLPKFSLVNKSALRDAIVQQLRRDLATQTNAAQMARDEAISEESRAQNKWDTHSQEAAYLAESQAKIAGEIASSIELLSSLALSDFSSSDPIALGALVHLESAASSSARRSAYFLAPRAGGVEVTVEGETVLVVTPQSPLGRQLIGRRIGDSVTAPGRGASAQQRIVAVA
jgi:transcription elongation GreA/GreB family factor